MGVHSHSRTKKHGKRRRRKVEDSSNSDSSSSPSSASSVSMSSLSSDGERSRKRHRSSDEKHRRRSSSRKDKKSRRDKKHKRMGKERRRSHIPKRDKSKKKIRDYSDSDGSDSDSRSDYGSDGQMGRESPEEVVKRILEEFPAVAGDLEQLLLMIDGGQAVDIKGLSEKTLIKHLRKLFVSLKLKEKGDNCFLLPSKSRPTLEVVGTVIQSHVPPNQQAKSENGTQSEQLDSSRQVTKDATVIDSHEEVGPTSRRMFGPEMPSAELLAAAAKLTEAEAEMREAELETDNEVFIGPPPPAVVIEAESSNEAERFEEITRIMAAEMDSPYDILGVNRNMLAENMKKRYWKLSLMVHPDKCSHPQAHQAFVKLNKAFKELQDPEKRKALDEKIKEKEEQEQFKAELKTMREAAEWRRLQGISIEGDDILLAETDLKVAPKRDEWMTTLPPERKPGMTMQSTRFSKCSKEGRGDTSVWTDTPSERAQKAKMNYLEAYNEAAALASNEQEKQQSNADAELVDQYNKAKRSKTLVEKHQESIEKRSKKKSKQEPVKEEWEGKHPWKPWDREKDLTAGRQSVNLDPENMSKGLSSRFSSGSFQRNFL